MAAQVLRSSEAVAMSVHVVRAFVRLRRMLINHDTLAAKLSELDARVGTRDGNWRPSSRQPVIAGAVTA